MKAQLYTIGEMAKICNLSTEQLRHYDKLQILSPRGRGKRNNYRYYTENQIEDILIIKELKNVGIPLKTIAQLIRDKDLKTIKSSLESNMMAQRSALQEAQKTYDALVDTLLRLNSALSTISSSMKSPREQIQEGFSIVSIAERPIVFTRYRSNCSVNDSFIYRYAELLNTIEREKITTARSWFLLFHDSYQRQFLEGEAAVGDLELFANITGSIGSSKNCRIFGGFLAACATHVGHYRNTKRVYDELTRWVSEIGYRTSGISFQELIVGRTLTQNEDNFVTKIYLPLDVDDV